MVSLGSVEFFSLFSIPSIVSRPNDKTKPENRKQKTGRRASILPVYGEKSLNEMYRRYKIAEPFTKLTDWKGKPANKKNGIV